MTYRLARISSVRTDGQTERQYICTTDTQLHVVVPPPTHPLMGTTQYDTYTKVSCILQLMDYAASYFWSIGSGSHTHSLRSKAFLFSS